MSFGNIMGIKMRARAFDTKHTNFQTVLIQIHFILFQQLCKSFFLKKLLKMLMKCKGKSEKTSNLTDKSHFWDNWATFEYVYGRFWDSMMYWWKKHEAPERCIDWKRTRWRRDVFRVVKRVTNCYNVEDLIPFSTALRAADGCPRGARPKWNIPERIEEQYEIYFGTGEFRHDGRTRVHIQGWL